MTTLTGLLTPWPARAQMLTSLRICNLSAHAALGHLVMSPFRRCQEPVVFLPHPQLRGAHRPPLTHAGGAIEMGSVASSDEGRPEGRVAGAAAERTASRTSPARFKSRLLHSPARRPWTSSLLSLGLYLQLCYGNNIGTSSKDLWSEISERIPGKPGACTARTRCTFAPLIVLGVIFGSEEF